VGGSNGEFVYLSVEERLEVVRAARAAIPRDRLLIAGSGMESTRQTIALSEGMAAAGADAVIVVTPSYYRGRMDALAYERHYRQVSQASAVPVLLYSVPANTGIELPAPAVIRLAAEPNIVGIKDSGGNISRIAGLVSDSPDGFQVLAGSASFFLAALTVGAVGRGSAGQWRPAGDRVADAWPVIWERRSPGPAAETESRRHRRMRRPGLKAARTSGFWRAGAPPLQPLVRPSAANCARSGHGRECCNPQSDKVRSDLQI
jgi:hypothetical protein